jgi:hypothetical protein
MTTGNTTLLGLALPVEGELDGTWGDVVNDSITSLVDSAVAGTTTLSADIDVELTTTVLAANQARQAILRWTASNGATTRNITAPAQSKPYIVINAGTGSIVLRGAGTPPTTGITIIAGERCVAAWSGADFVKIATSTADGVTSVDVSGGTTGLTTSGGPVTSSGTITLAGTLAVANGGTGVTTSTGTGSVVLSNSPTLVTPALGTPSSGTLTNATGLPIDGGTTGTLPIARGGTNATTAPDARTSLGATTLGSNVFTITNPSAVTFPRFNADNTVSSLDAADFRTAIGAGSGAGSVTSVDVSGGTTGLTTTGGPVTASGTITLAGTLAVANGGTGQTTRQAALDALAGAVTAGQYLRGDGTDVVMSAIQAADVPTLNQNTTGTAANVTGVVAIANGGTGATSFAAAGLATLAGTETLTNKTVEAGTFTNGYTEETVVSNTGTAFTINLANGTVQYLTLTGNCTYTFPTPVAGRSFILIQRQDGTGGRTVTWPATVDWPGATAPTLTSTANRADKFVFTAIDGSNWLGSNAGQNYTV